ncbi:MAG: hypothetical protein ACXWLB_12865 [Reyranella sp.]
MSNTGTVLSFEEGLLASRTRKRLGLTLAPRSMINYGCNTIDGRHNARPATVPTAGRMNLMLPAGLIGRELPMIEHAMMEAAIQLDLITPEQAEALVEKGKTLGEWLVEQEEAKADKARKVRQRILDAVGVLALLLFNLVVLAGIGWIVLRVLRLL